MATARKPAKPFDIGPPPKPRDPAGKFLKLPENPLDELAAGKQAQDWAPGIGQGTAQTHGEPLPWQHPNERRSFKNLSTGRK